MKSPIRPSLQEVIFFTSMHPLLTGTLWRLGQQGINEYKHPFFYVALTKHTPQLCGRTRLSPVILEPQRLWSQSPPLWEMDGEAWYQETRKAGRTCRRGCGRG